MHTAVFLAGFTGVLGKLITLNAGLLVWYRLLISIVTLWLLFFFNKRLPWPSARDILKLTGVGTVVILHWVTFYASIKYSNVSVGLVCFSATGFFTALLEPLFLRRRFVMAEVLLGLLVMAGIYIIFQFDPTYKTGIVIGIISAVFAAIFPIFNRQLSQRIDSESITTFELTGGFMVLTILMPFYLRQFPADHILPTWQDGWGLLFLAWVCTVWAFRLAVQALKKVSAFTVSLSYNLEPVYGILMAFILFHENKYLGPSFYVGVFMIVLSVVLQTMRAVSAFRSI